MRLNRRRFLRASSTALLCTAGCGGAPRAAAPGTPRTVAGPAPAPVLPQPRVGALRILAVGAHPDDPESGCGGTLLRLTEAGHKLTVLYVTRGENGIGNVTREEAGRIREAEGRAACATLGAQPIFFGEKNGELQLTHPTAGRLSQVFRDLAPDVIFTHWPLDVDIEHQMTGILTVRASIESNFSGLIYFYEVETGTQTIGFTPTVYVDITSTRERKLKALLSHASQNAEERIYVRHHEPMERFRGRELGASAAEAFMVLGPNHKRGELLGL